MRRFNLKVSPEKIPWREYKLLQLAVVAPFSIFMAYYLELVSYLSRKNSKLENFDRVPENAILFGFHEDIMTNYVTMRLIKKNSENPCVFSGFHGFFSYVSFGPGAMGAYDVFRFYYGKKIKPRDQIINFLAKNTNRRFGIFTDAGGPFYKVRKSLVELAIKTKRPLVPFRSRYSPGVIFFNNKFPLPIIKGKSLFGEPIDCSKLSNLNIQNARDYLQEKIDEL